METSRHQDLRRVIVRERGRMLVVAIEDVDWIQSADNYALLHVGATTHVVRETLTRLEARAAAGRFVRISRTAMVNVHRVREIVPSPTGHVLILAGGHRLPIRRGIREVLARIEAA